MSNGSGRRRWLPAGSLERLEDLIGRSSERARRQGLETRAGRIAAKRRSLHGAPDEKRMRGVDCRELSSATAFIFGSSGKRAGFQALLSTSNALWICSVVASSSSSRASNALHRAHRTLFSSTAFPQEQTVMAFRLPRAGIRFRACHHYRKAAGIGICPMGRGESRSSCPRLANSHRRPHSALRSVE